MFFWHHNKSKDGRDKKSRNRTSQRCSSTPNLRNHTWWKSWKFQHWITRSIPSLHRFCCIGRSFSKVMNPKVLWQEVDPICKGVSPEWSAEQYTWYTPVVLSHEHALSTFIAAADHTQVYSLFVHKEGTDDNIDMVELTTADKPACGHVYPWQLLSFSTQIYVWHTCGPAPCSAVALVADILHLPTMTVIEK